ncbi:MAG: hypothetical protein BWX66_02161 [Deltaproteobacteria bacterium ADurb.Bin058]|nr:MAG: hypothetical protein BWX66_02161 [Deltaproteobacteria bacterium ADurb.Bin058]
MIGRIQEVNRLTLCNVQVFGYFPELGVSVVTLGDLAWASSEIRGQYLTIHGKTSTNSNGTTSS